MLAEDKKLLQLVDIIMEHNDIFQLVNTPLEYSKQIHGYIITS